MEFRRKRKLTQDERALEGLPLQLLIIAIVISIGLPVVYGSIKTQDSRRMMQEMEEQAVFIGQKAKQLYLHGEGNSDIITLELEDGIFHEVGFLEVTNETFRDQIQWSISGGKEGRHFIKEDVLLFSDETPLRLGEGEHRLKLECHFGSPLDTEDKTLYIEVTPL
ncbi:MAG: hypothetical protein ACLFSM_06200 [Thermoplasmata archaeon]